MAFKKEASRVSLINPFCSRPLFAMTVESCLPLSQCQWWTAADRHSPLSTFVSWNVVIQSRLNFKKRLVHSGVGRGENPREALSLCLLPSIILSYFLLICSSKMCAESSALLGYFSVFLPSFSGFAFIEWNPLVWFSAHSHWGCECPLTQFRATIEQCIKSPCDCPMGPGLQNSWASHCFPNHHVQGLPSVYGKHGLIDADLDSTLFW